MSTLHIQQHLFTICLLNCYKLYGRNKPADLLLPLGPGPSLPPWLGGLHHQPVQCHTHACDTIILAASNVIKEETASQLCVG